MYPSLEEVKLIASQGEYRRIPVCRELYADRFTPVEVMRTLRAASKHCYLLESAENDQKWGRYSMLGYEPILELSCLDGKVRIRTEEEQIAPSMKESFLKEEYTEVVHPGELIRKILAEYKSPKIKGMPPFTGGMVGYFSYDYLKYAEPTLKKYLSGS